MAGIEASKEQIDASALEDYHTKYIGGRDDVASELAVTFNWTDEVQTQIEAMITAYNALSDGKKMWFTIWSPYHSKAPFFTGEPPLTIGSPEMGQNELETLDLTFVVGDYKGWDTAIEPAASA